jgi:hypothetical protein
VSRASNNSGFRASPLFSTTGGLLPPEVCICLWASSILCMRLTNTYAGLQQTSPVGLWARQRKIQRWRKCCGKQSTLLCLKHPSMISSTMVSMKSSRNRRRYLEVYETLKADANAIGPGDQDNGNWKRGVRGPCAPGHYASSQNGKWACLLAYSFPFQDKIAHLT